MAGAFSHTDLLALERLRTNVLEIVVLARDETRGRGVVAGSEIGLLERLGADTHRRDGRVCVAVIKGLIDLTPIDGLHLALDLELLADGLGEIDVEAGERAHLIEIMERRVVAVGDERQLVEPMHVWPRPKHVALPGVGHDLVLGLLRASRRWRKRAKSEHKYGDKNGCRRKAFRP